MNEILPMTSASAALLDVPALPALADLELFTPDAAVLDRHSIVGFDSRDLRARPFNMLRTQVAKRIANSGADIIGITSATPNAGKSFLSPEEAGCKMPA